MQPCWNLSAPHGCGDLAQGPCPPTTPPRSPRGLQTSPVWGFADISLLRNCSSFTAHLLTRVHRLFIHSSRLQCFFVPDRAATARDLRFSTCAAVRTALRDSAAYRTLAHRYMSPRLHGGFGHGHSRQYCLGLTIPPPLLSHGLYTRFASFMSALACNAVPFPPSIELRRFPASRLVAAGFLAPWQSLLRGPPALFAPHTPAVSRHCGVALNCLARCASHSNLLTAALCSG